MALSDDDLAALSRLLDEALALPADAREGWLAARPPEQQHLLPRLRRLLAEPDAGAELPALPALDEPEARAGERLGPWRLLHEIGRGGMGSVWLAERADGLYERQVALKLPRLARGPRLAERLAREQRIVARLEHPHIARLYDAGVAADGRPYLVMEFVPGARLLDHCRAQRLDRPSRLRLLLQLCDAVAFAHRQLVVHRDIKPSNLMVDADGRARLLDFGIARLLDADGADGAGSDGRGTHTPGYAAPEQLAGGSVSAAADIFSLGVVLRDLLQAEGAAPGPDLAAVIARATQAEPAARYPSVERLADDLARVLAHRPVLAGPLPRGHRARLFLRRHAVVLGLAGLVAGAALLAWQQQAGARAQAARAARAQAFVATLLEQTEPRRAGDPAGFSAAEMLQQALERARAAFAAEPALRGEVQVQIGMMLRRVSPPGSALPAFREAHATLAAALPADDPARQLGAAQLALELQEAGAADEAALERLVAEAMAPCDGAPAACARVAALGHAAQRERARRRGDTEATLRHGEAAVEAADRGWPPPHAEAVLSRLNLALVQRNAGRLSEAAATLEQAGRHARGLTLGTHTRVQLRLQQAIVQADLGRDADAVLALRALESDPEAAWQLATVRRLLAQSLHQQGRWPAALQAADAALGAADALGDPWEAALARQARARALALLGRGVEAAAQIAEVQAALAAQGYRETALPRLRARRIEAEIALRGGAADRAQPMLASLEAALGGPTASAALELAQVLDLQGALARKRGAADEAVRRHAEAAARLAALPAEHPLRRRNRVEAARAAALRQPGPAADAALAAAVDPYLQELPADSGWQPLLKSLRAGPAAAVLL